MKKISIFFLILLFICVFNINNVNADVDVSWYFSGNVVVSNKEGAVWHEQTFNGEDHTFIIPYGEVLEPGRMYGNDIGVTYNGKSGWVDYHDIKPLEEYYYPENIDFENNYEEKVVLNDVYALYKGPALCYDKIDWIYIPKESVVKCNIDSDTYWHYIEYEGIQGWIYLFEISDEEGLTNTPLIASAYNKTGWIFEDERFSEVKIKYRFTYGRSISYYYEHDGILESVHFENIWFDGNNQNIYITSDALEIYADDQYTKRIDTIKYDGELKVIKYQQTGYLGAYRYGGVYVEYADGKEGFVNCEENVVAIWSKDLSDKNPQYNKDGICYLYSKPVELKENVISEIPEGSRINHQYYYRFADMDPGWYHIDDGEYCGWVCDEELYANAKDKYNDQETKKEKVDEEITNENIIVEEEKADSYNIFDAFGYVLLFVIIISMIICYFNKDKIKKIINKKH